MSTIELETAKSLPDISIKESEVSIVQEKIQYRRKRTNQLRLQGYTNQEIASKIGCDLSTVEKDLHVIRESSRYWFEEDAVTEYCQSMSESIILCDIVTEELQLLYEEQDDADMKLEILFMIIDLGEKKTALYEKTKAVKHYLKDDKINFLINEELK